MTDLKAQASHPSRSLQFPHTVPRIQPGDLVGLGEGGIVEGVLDEIFDRALEVQHRLADVDEFGGTFADDVDAEQAADFRTDM